MKALSFLMAEKRLCIPDNGVDGMLL